jgi:hypothetical protein
MPPEGFNAPGDLDKCCGRDYILLANHQLEIQGDDEHGELQKGAIDQFVIHLKSLTGVDKLNPDYDKSTPAAGFVAAQMDLRRGALTPLLPDDKKTWIFKHKNEQFKKDPVCLAQGVRLALTLKPGSVVKIVSSNAGATLSLKAHDDRPTLVRIGNSMKEDILCPIPTADSDDPHFRNFYRMLTRQPAKPWTPEKTEQKCYAPALKARMAVKVGILSHHGSNCIPAQWP